MGNKKEQTREMILEASYPLFAKDGFNKITMKDICEATGLSRGGLYSHFSGTGEIFETILSKLNEKDEMDFQKEIDEKMPAPEILERALRLMEYEMKHSEDSLSLAMYEYAGSISGDVMGQFTESGEKKWTDLINYGIRRKEFKRVDVHEIVSIILYAYQGVRMWSRIVSMTDSTFRAVTEHIKKQLLIENS